MINQSLSSLISCNNVLKTLAVLTIGVAFALPVAAQSPPKKITFAAPNWQKPFATMISADGKRAEVLAWEGSNGLWRYTWKYPSKQLVRVGKVSDGYTDKESKEVTKKKLEIVKASVARNLGLSGSEEAKRATLLADWNKEHNQRDSTGYPPYKAQSVSTDGDIVIAVKRNGNCFSWSPDKGFVDLNAKFGLDNYKYSYQSYLALSPGGSNIFWVDETAVAWVNNAPAMMYITGTIKSISPGRYTILVSSVVPPGGKTVTLSPPRNKVVLLPPTVMAPKSIKVGTKVTVSGQDAGKGTPLTASAIRLK